MEKKHISIIGSCVSRHLFNTPILESTFTVDRYAYQVCPWDAVREGLNISKDEVQKYYKEEFTARMIWYDLAKVSLSEVESMKSEYLLIDLYTMIQDVISFSLNGKTVYAQVSYDRYSSFINAIETASWKDMVVQREGYSKKDDSFYLEGLERFAKWVLENFEPEKVIINIPPFATNYFDIENNYKRYSDAGIAHQKVRFEWMQAMSCALAELIPGSKLLRLCDEPSTAQFGIYDVVNDNPPTNVHYTDEDYLRYSERLLETVGLEYPKTVHNALTPLGFECVRFRNLYLKTREMCKKTQAPKVETEKIFVYETNLNEYVQRIENLEDFIIVISAKDEAKYSLAKFTERDKLGLKMELVFRGSYIAVVDKSRDFVYENASEEKQSYDYEADGCTFSVCSGGYLSGNASSIKREMNGESNEFSQNRRGLNIAIFNSKSFELVDMFKCDTHLDTALKIDSLYLADRIVNYKVKV